MHYFIFFSNLPFCEPARVYKRVTTIGNNAGRRRRWRRASTLYLKRRVLLPLSLSSSPLEAYDHLLYIHIYRVILFSFRYKHNILMLLLFHSIFIIRYIFLKSFIFQNWISFFVYKSRNVHVCILQRILQIVRYPVEIEIQYVA